MKQSRKQTLKRIANVNIVIGVMLWIVAMLFISVPLFPNFWYQVNQNAINNEAKALTDNIDSDKKAYEDQKPEEPQEPEKPEDNLPPIDPTLPLENRIIISKIGVDAKIEEGADFNAALEKGPWIVNDFGMPDNQFAPIIIASHRWGYTYWTDEMRQKVSFLELPNTVAGDRVEIIWGQRKFVYEIYAGEENTAITDYGADLILYTCKLYWDSPERIFRYAKRVEI